MCFVKHSGRIVWKAAAEILHEVRRCAKIRIGSADWGEQVPPSLAVDSQTPSAKSLEGYGAVRSDASVWEGSFYLVALVDAAIEPTVSKCSPPSCAETTGGQKQRSGGQYVHGEAGADGSFLGHLDWLMEGDW